MGIWIYYCEPEVTKIILVARVCEGRVYLTYIGPEGMENNKEGPGQE